MDFDDLVQHVSVGLTIVVCSPSEFAVKNGQAGTHLEILHSARENKHIVLICCTSESPPLDLVGRIKDLLNISRISKCHCYYGSDDSSKIFALRLNCLVLNARLHCQIHTIIHFSLFLKSFSAKTMECPVCLEDVDESHESLFNVTIQSAQNARSVF